MIGGQVLDLQAEGKALGLAELERMNRLKTGAMLRAAVRCGALAAGASSCQLRALTGYASGLGLAFQIVDDLLDLEGTAEQLGKEPGEDLARLKATYPAMLGVEAARRRAAELYEQSIRSLEGLGRPAELLRHLARRLVFRTA